jgi:tetratricopeptide (TPR) repeat protein
MHTNFNRDVYLLGTPIFAIVTAILERCITLDQAIALLVSTPRICGLSLVIVDSKNREAAAVGFTANHHEILRLDNDILVRTNHYLTDDMKRHEVAPHAWMMHSQARFTRLHELLAEKRGTLLAEDIPRMLADDLDPWERRRRVVGTIVNATNNAQSVVLSPEEDAMWLANGKFPTCSSDCFVGFRISALFDRDRSNYAIGDLRGSDVLSAREREAQRHYQLAWIAHNDNRRDDLATFHLRCAGNLLPDEPIFPRLAGLILLKHQKLEQALPLLRKNAQYEYKSEIMYAESQVWLARCLDLMGRRDEALCHYRRAAMLDTPPVCHAASRHLLHPFKLKHLSQIMPEFIVGTALSKW